MKRLALLALFLCACKSNAPKQGPGGALVLASLSACPTEIVADGEHVYFTTKEGFLGRIPKKGGKVETIANNLKTPTGLIVGDAIYVAVQGAIITYPKNGGSAVTVAGTLALVQGLTMDADTIYFVDYVKDTSTIARVPKAGGNIDRLQSVPGLVSRLALDEKNLYFVVQHELVRLPKLGGFRNASGVTIQGDALRADGKYVFALDGTSFVRVNKSDGKPLKLADFKGAPKPFLDDRDVVWNEGTDRILAVSIEGGRAREVALDQPYPRAVTGDFDNVYWSSCASDTDPGTISKKPRN